MASPVKMNAKERRKLQRQQQQEAAAAAPAVTAEPKEEASEATLNAKERRKLQREQQRKEEATKEAKAAVKKEIKQEASVPVKKETAAPAADVAAPATGERLNAKERRLLQRKATRGEDPTASSKKETSAEGAQIGKKRKRKGKSGDEADEAEQEAKRKRIHLTLFVGQLPFKCTEAMVRKHFAEAGEIQLRMLTDKKTKKFKGTAFIEVKDSKALGAALSRHHTLLNGRRINVELTASGGGNNSELRRGKIDSLRKKQSEKQIEKTRALVQKCIDAPGSKLKADDVDERMIDYLSWFDYTTAKTAMDEYNRCVSDRVKNTKAFFMGILKRFRQTDGVE